MRTGLFLSTMMRADLYALYTMALGLILGASSCDNKENDLGLGHQMHADFGSSPVPLYPNFAAYRGNKVHLEVEPTGQLTQVFYYQDANNLATHPIVLRDVIKIKGSALDLPEDLLLENQAPGTKSGFFEITAIPAINNTEFLTPRMQTRKSYLTSAGYQLELLENLAYTIVLNPNGRGSKPPFHVTLGLLNSDQQLDFLINKKGVKAKGRVTSDDQLVFSDTDRPLMQARLMQGHRLASSVTLVNNMGEFSLAITKPLFDDLKEQAVTLVIEPLDAESPLPRIEKELDPRHLESDFNLGSLSLGILKKPIALNIELRGNDSKALGPAFVYLKASIGRGVSLIKKQAEIGQTAKIKGLYKGRYDIAVLPPASSNYAMQEIKGLDLKEPSTKISIKLTKRQELGARILDPLGKPLNAAQIEFLRVEEVGDTKGRDIYEDMAFKIAALTNEAGQVCQLQFGPSLSDHHCERVKLDEGRYLAHVIPPAGIDISHKWFTFDFPKQNHLTIQLDKPQVLSGKIVAKDGVSPVKNAFITVYHADESRYNQAKMLGNAITDDQGFFKAFVSSP